MRSGGREKGAWWPSVQRSRPEESPPHLGWCRSCRGLKHGRREVQSAKVGQGKRVNPSRTTVRRAGCLARRQARRPAATRRPPRGLTGCQFSIQSPAGSVVVTRCNKRPRLIQESRDERGCPSSARFQECRPTTARTTCTTCPRSFLESAVDKTSRPRQNQHCISGQQQAFFVRWFGA